MMRRRQLLIGLASTVIVPVQARAQQPKVPLVAILTDDPSVKVGAIAVFQEKLGELGWMDGNTIRFERRVPDLAAQTMSTHATDLVNLAPDALVSVGTVYTEALAERTRRIPIVFINASDPILSGFSDSLSKPSRNLTGFTVFDPAMGGKMLQLLKDVNPDLRKVALMSNPDASSGRQIASAFWTRTQQFAREMNIELTKADVHSTGDIETVISGMKRSDGLFVSADQFLYANRHLIIDLALRQNVPAIYPWPGYVTDGGLMAYTSDPFTNFRGAAVYVDQLLRGTKLESLPIQLPTTFALHINLATARSLGLEISRELLVQAHRIVE
jgi:putative ABC transport system substrate-binding protein